MKNEGCGYHNKALAISLRGNVVLEGPVSLKFPWHLDPIQSSQQKNHPQRNKSTQSHHPESLTWKLETVSKEIFYFSQGLVFRFHIKLHGCRSLLLTHAFQGDEIYVTKPRRAPTRGRKIPLTTFVQAACSPTNEIVSWYINICPGSPTTILYRLVYEPPVLK